MTTIETIMRNRRQKADDRTHILKQTGVKVGSIDCSMREHGEGGNQTAGFNEEVDLRDGEDSEAGGSFLIPPAFTYHKLDATAVPPKENMVGVSRSKSVNKFTVVNRKRVLSFLPELSRKYAGKLSSM